METSNVNNLNGIPNFGHGFPEDEMEEIESVEEDEEISEVTKETKEVEIKNKKK